MRRERERWQRRALAIPDPVLRADALLTIEEKWGHSEGAAAFAVLAPRATRATFVRMVVAYQLMIDYLDTISERPVSDPWANTLQLHGAAQNGVALSLTREPDYYMFHSHRGDGGFLSALVSTCREMFMTLPSCAAVAPRAEHLTSLYAMSQGHCHAEQAGHAPSGPTDLIDAAAAQHPELSWGEVLAACNTSIPVFALMTQAAWEDRSEVEIALCHSAYFPWTASLHILLHSLVDEIFDLETGKFNQLGHYRSKPQAAEALASIASQARERLARLPQADTHLVLFGGMAGYYLAAPSAWQEENRLIAAPVRDAIGPPARWSMFIHRLRRGFATT
ncbi:MAG TPA: DUF2600 family protein [Solirubrobacterales bacterium]